MQACGATSGVRMKYGLMRFGLAVGTSLGLFAGQIPIRPTILRSALTVVKFFGLFRIARYITRNGLRIICYHGFAVAEEYKFRGRLFIRKELFRHRIEYLQRKRFPILSLSAAVNALDQDRLPPCATVITMDDAW